jgi:tetratricopeptide (TPR) repeat protein
MSGNKLNFDVGPSKIANIESEQYFKSLFVSNTFEDLTNEEYLKRISFFVDLSFYKKRTDGLEKSSVLIEDFLKRDLTSYERSLSHYYLANAFDNKNHLKHKRGEIFSKWDNCELEGEILNLRLSLKHLQFARDNEFTKNKKTKLEIASFKQRNCQIYTNLGNLMDNIGRFIEGIEYRDEALNIDPKFGMALGNKGLSYIWYAPFLPSKKHQAFFYHEAYRLLKSALLCQLEPDAPEGFRNAMITIESMLKIEYLNKKINLNPSIDGSKNEIKYKSWCLRNHLFLNPLNDLGSHTIAAKDELLIPAGDMRVDYGINCHTFFNQLKQEFVAARYLYYEGITENKIHFSDRDIVFGETYDRPLLSLASEKIKISFRLSYSIFDKIAFFLNYYFNLDLKERDIYFRSIWYENRKKNNEEKQILSFFRDKNKNLPLIGLFWLSKDLYEKNTGFVDALEPDAKGWYDMRNSLEHKYFKITFFDPKNDPLSSVIDDINSPFMYSIPIVDFEKKTLKLLKTTRNALIYLAIAVNWEEKHKGGENKGQVNIEKKIEK